MKAFLVLLPLLIGQVIVSDAGRPIIMPLPDACAHTDLVILATISNDSEIPEPEESFMGSKWTQYGFTHVADVTIEKALMGKRPKSIRLYGGKLGGGTLYRLDSGRFLVMLKEVEPGAYRAVDYHYSLMPYEDGKVEWITERHPRITERISPAEAARRINNHKWEQNAAYFPNGIQLHWFVILIAGAFGALFHFTGEWAVNHAIAMNEEFDPAPLAGDREFIALQDIWFVGLLAGGAVLGGIATLMIKKPNKPTQDNRGGC